MNLKREQFNSGNLTMPFQFSRENNRPAIVWLIIMVEFMFCLMARVLFAAADSGSSLVQEISLQKYYPAPFGAYFSLRLTPRDTLPNPCYLGSVYADANQHGNLMFCQDNGSGGYEWGPIPGYWQQKEDDVYTILYDSMDIGSLNNDLKLTIDGDGGLMAKGEYGAGAVLPDSTTTGSARYIWYPRRSILRSGQLSDARANLWNDINSGDYSVVAGGLDNQALGQYSGVGGGYWNSALANYSAVGGGRKNLIINGASYGTIVGGGAMFNTPGDDVGNTVNSIASFVGGGEANIAGLSSSLPDETSHATICGNEGNQAQAKYSTICVGATNIASSRGSTVCGGNANEANGQYSTVIGGSYTSGGSALHNRSNGDYSVIGGGYGNLASGHYSVIGRGKVAYSSVDTPNSASSDYSVIVAGSNNLASTGLAVGFGVASSHGPYAIIANGDNNLAHGSYSFTGGSTNVNDGDYTTVLGRNLSVDFSIAKSFVWGAPSNVSLGVITPSGNNNFIIYTGRVGIGTANPATALHVNGQMKVEGNNNTVIISGISAISGSANNLKWKNPSGQVGFDIAEVFDVLNTVDIADVVIVDENSTAKLKVSQHPNDSHVVGIVSMAPAILLDGSTLKIAPGIKNLPKGEHAAVAIAGRVLCKVTDEGGAIVPGDFLTTSSTKGHAMKVKDPQTSWGTIVAKALEPFPGESGKHEGQILVAVGLK